MASKAALKRLNKEYLAMQSNPTPFITAKPLDTNILEWHYVLRGPPETPYEGGEYHGRIRFPSDYPYKPPSLQMITPSGRFQTNTNICMSMSNFHPDTWNPAWSVSTILNGMLSFMVEEEATTGSIRASTADRKALARKSHKINLANKMFRELFPELCTQVPTPITQSASSTVAAPALQKGTEDGNVGRNTLQNRGAGRNNVPSGAAVVATANNHHQATGMWLTTLPRKWLILFVVVAYFFASKIISRLLTA
ncbi:ubiquitin-conjugating enzyme E2 J2 [Coemansia reversa NRRL 1564]|uniref:Ubiquitin-conjugating enzyme E2 6 n=1 Tax=Coemansia reversa (strain ATCC 12441 / NRRL 1564) TaxID=763665 RepID=A0A2G5BF83_COERN|nr:ubiquitin-conjugating enzyme E2 J2 [Coemansia reversa NRRL 1564]|eukprot:PIA17670.1 ubiquitin-conjugating enzyme E2 J2 [Coemansia reversa NRRL 1564]